MLDADRYIVSQRFTAMVNRYEVAEADADDKPGRLVAFVEQKRMALKEDLRAFTDDRKASELFRIKARQVFDPRARYDVTAPEEGQIGQLGKVFGRSLLRSTWEVFDAGGERVAWAQERSLFVALWRRFIDFVPVVGDVLGLIPVMFHFDLHAIDDHRRLGGVTRRIGLRDRYVLDLEGDPDRVVDRRLAVALAVGLDALQSR